MIGRTARVNTILIVKMSENGRVGKAYIPFPVKYKSKYVPKSDAISMAGIYLLIPDGLFGKGCELEPFKCLTVSMPDLPINHIV